MSAAESISNRGRGPEIKGTRITVYAVLDYLLEGWTPERIATLFDVRPNEIEAAIEYIREHAIEVLKDYVAILERAQQGNPPELQAKLDANHQKFQELVAQVRQVKERADAEIRELIQRHRSSPAKENAHASHHGGQ